jgi:sec-independent protein translocase protein TatB
MFDIGFAELVLVAVVALLVLGPERMPGAVRSCALWIARLRRSINAIKSELEREFNTDQIKQDLHNASILRQLGHEGDRITDNLDEVRASLKELEYTLDEPSPLAPSQNTPQKRDDH